MNRENKTHMDCGLKNMCVQIIFILFYFIYIRIRLHSYLLIYQAVS